MGVRITESGFVRLNCRVSARVKQQAQDAAALLGLSLTALTESVLADKAQAVLERHERIILSEGDFARFVAAIENPPEPTEKLKSAVADYRKRFPNDRL